MAWLRRNWYRIAVHGAGLVPLVMMGVYYLSDVLVNPTRYIILRICRLSITLIANVSG